MAGGLGSAPLLTVAAPPSSPAAEQGLRHKATSISGLGPQRRLRTALGLRPAETRWAESGQAPPGAKGSGGRAPGGQRAEDSPWTPFS